jgi:hypothetical protein
MNISKYFVISPVAIIYIYVWQDIKEIQCFLRTFSTYAIKTDVFGFTDDCSLYERSVIWLSEY